MEVYLAIKDLGVRDKQNNDNVFRNLIITNPYKEKLQALKRNMEAYKGEPPNKVSFGAEINRRERPGTFIPDLLDQPLKKKNTIFG
jgi:hypothetical protein